MCTVLKVHPSGYYKWLKQPISNLEIKNQQILQEIKKAYKESNGIYGYRNIHKDLKASNIHVNKKRVARLMKEAKLPDFVAFLIKKVRIPIIKALRLFLSHFWVTHVIIVHVCKKKNKLKWLNKCPNFRKN